MLYANLKYAVMLGEVIPTEFQDEQEREKKSYVIKDDKLMISKITQR